MTFGHPYFLLLLLALPVLGWLKGKQGKPPAFVYSSVQLVRRILNVTRTRSGAFLAALHWLILALLIIALILLIFFNVTAQRLAKKRT